MQTKYTDPTIVPILSGLMGFARFNKSFPTKPLRINIGEAINIDFEVAK